VTPPASRQPYRRAPAFWLGVLLTLLVGVASLTGRYDITANTDLSWDLMNAWHLIHEGVIPRHSGVSSMYSMIPPGISWGMLPGMLVFPHHPVMAERLVAALMYGGCLLGLFCWLNPRLGFWPTALAMLIFSAGGCGAFFETSLWPRSHPVFYVWFLYALTLWVERRNGAWLAAAAVIYAAGMYWFMEMAPALFVVPVLYALYRPPVRLPHMGPAVAACLLIWASYLMFEAGRDFADLKSLLTRVPVHYGPDVFDTTYHKGNHLIKSWDVPRLKAGVQSAKENEVSDGFWLYTEAWGTIWAQTEERRYLDEDGFVFYSDKLGCWGFQSFESGRLLLQGRDKWEQGVYPVDFPTSRSIAHNEGLTLLRSKQMLQRQPPLFNFGGDQSFGIWVWQIALMLFALAYAFRKSGLIGQCGAALRSWWQTMRLRKTAPDAPGMQPDGVLWTVLLTGVLVPTLLLALMLPANEIASGNRRFWWIWMSEAALIGSALGTVRIRNRRALLPLGAIAVMTFAMNPRLGELARGAFRRWPGGERGRGEQAIGELARIIKAEGRDSARIGYDLNMMDWLPSIHKVDGFTKAFIDWDIALFLAHGITNLDTTAEGLHPDDEFRIFSPEYNIPANAMMQLRWSMSADGSLPRMEMVAQVGGFQILRRVGDASEK
jgi:hypothetical protein